MSKQEQLQYLTELSNAGVVNVEAAVPYMIYKFPELTEDQAKQIVQEWINSKFLTESKSCGCKI
jgi:hypothetical protein